MGLAQKLAATCFRPGDLLILTGSLGTGKTVFIRGLAKGLGLDENEVNSPSFTLVNEYPGERPLYHFDLYRIESDSELGEIGWDDYLSRDGIVAVEWGEKIKELIPGNFYQLKFSIAGELDRKIDITYIT